MHIKRSRRTAFNSNSAARNTPMSSEVTVRCNFALFTNSALLSAHRQGDFRVISAPAGDGYSGALSSMSRWV